ncbi:ATP-binding protein [Streptomyces sp. NPDC048664]|uniref:ATP-binding protein n=1 Tax=Streptomyces sp. NPDC048664 TaxID=3154505 RepID=UPI0034156FF6
MNADIASAPAARPDPSAPARHFTISLSATPRGARLARHLAAEQLDKWGRPYGTGANDTVTLLVSELASNAVRHGRVVGRDFRLRLTLYPESATLRVEVTDARPGRRPPGPGNLTPVAADREGGRGLLVVEALATHWGATSSDPYTKTVWCEIALD